MSAPPDETELLAAEYVLGLLDAPDEARAAQRVHADAAFATLVETWRARFAELDITAPAGAPDPALFARIAATLDQDEAPVSSPRAAPEPSPARAETAPAGPSAGRATHGGADSLMARLWDSLGFWRTAGFAGAAASLLLVLAIAFSPLGRAPQPQFVAVLMGAQGEPAAVVNAYADGTADLIPLRPIAVPDGRVLEVWTLQDPARGPVSIGLAGEARRIRLDLKNLPRTGPDQLFEITLEPRGGSPIGRPTGPILMKGTTSLAL